MPVAVFDSRDQLEQFCKAYLNTRFRYLIELLQNGPLPASVIADHVGSSMDIVRRDLSDLVKMGLIKEVKVKDSIIYAPKILLLPQLGVKIPDELAKSLGERLFAELVNFIHQRSEKLEELFNNLEGSCTPSRIALAVFFEALQKALESLQKLLAEEEKEVAKAFSRRRRRI